MLHILKRAVAKHVVRTQAKQLVTQGLYDGIDKAAVLEVCDRYPDHRQKKYRDMDHAFVRNAERVVRLGLTKCKGLRILDIGCGFGYFLHAAIQCGHTASGLDQPDPFFDEIAKLFGVERVLHRIEKEQPIPDAPGPFDLITAFATLFDNAGEEGQWGPTEWDFFLHDLTRFMTPDCHLHIKFNQYQGGGAKSGKFCQAVPDDLMEYFKKLGATFVKRNMDIPNIRTVLEESKGTN